MDEVGATYQCRPARGIDHVSAPVETPGASMTFMMTQGWVVAALAASLPLLVSAHAGRAPLRHQSLARVLHVDGNAATRPADGFASIRDAVIVAQPGDTIRVAAGTYAERLVTVRGGLTDAPIVITGDPQARAILQVPGRVATITHPHVRIEHLVLDGEFGTDDAVRVGSEAHHLVLRDVEVRRAGRDCIDMGSPTNVLIEDALVHSCLNAAGGRTDAHGIVAGAARNLTIRRTEVHTFSGDGIQLDPSRSTPGWTDVRIESCRFWLEPLREPANGFPAGTVPGENALDTKTPTTGDRARITVVDTTASGFGGGLIRNMAAFNLKERIDAVLDGVTVRDSDIGFRVRGPADTGAAVTIRNAVVHDVATAVRYEDDIDPLRIHHMTIGSGVTRVFQRAAAPAAHVEVRNMLVLGTTLPPEAAGQGLAVDARAFRNAAAHDYHLTPGSEAIDRGSRVADVTVDRDGQPRSHAGGPDLGAYEYCSSCAPSVPKGLRRRR